MKKFLLGILAGLVIAVVTGIVLTFAAVKFARRPPEPPKEAWLSLRLEGDLPEAPEVGAPIPALEDKSPMTVAEVWSVLRRAARDPKIKGVLFKPRGLTVGWGKIEEIRQGLELVRKAGKPVYAWLASPGTKEYYAATAADRIFLSPEDLVDLKGLRIEAAYYKGTLDKLGVEVEVEHIGKYKDAGDSYSRTSMSPETKESLNAVLDELFFRLCSTIGQSRHMTPEQVRALLDDGPFLAPNAKSRGLVDELNYESTVQQQLASAAHLSESQSIAARDYLKTMPELGGRKTKNIAYLVAQGDIVRGPIASLLGDERGINPQTMGRQLRQIGNDPTIRGVILRIDSPGGDAIASDEILDEVKKLSRKKPMVISMSDLAASGGYYIAMSGDPVVAYPGTLTGSIGVIYGKVNLKGLYTKIGVSKEILKRGRFADIDSDFQSLTPEGRAKLRESLQFIYDGFLKKVGEGRHKKPSEIDPVAQGRVWLGVHAQQKGLVDELGGLDKAIALLKKKADLAETDGIRLVPFPARRTWWDELFTKRDASGHGWGGGEGEASMLLRQLPVGVAPWLQGGVLRVMPFSLQIR
ncbi:signal peptide peptidase SppA [Paludibaculum fermentans]|uniref:Signal peptide peptidase SppA n=1 Tax=Paludibaculum fermentans TaxID=1473598 RepID=A0A7S7NLW9_PALFE|nr:signal peptide peptidase SppA [Paludibaculum fermentans]QOY85980.1 signal peptide peptidase SppA [Paludibaculum fermentans]